MHTCIISFLDAQTAMTYFCYWTVLHVALDKIDNIQEKVVFFYHTVFFNVHEMKLIKLF